MIAGVSVLSFGRTVGVAAQSLSIWGSSMVQASGSNSRRISAIIVWFMVDVIGISARRVIGFGFVSQAYRHESNLDCKHTGTIIRSVDRRRIGCRIRSSVYWCKGIGTVVVIFRVCGVRQGPISVLAKTLF